ncbi:DUF418 domain-containing protein [Metabacillus sp. Hm71]|uniref:DUF418 domain-containing protein n=1 Tax=Metabacillus sp. Hm71 TaxID=3450743 RepID=UPI003F442F55
MKDQQNRIILIDIIRGFSLLGILLVNMRSFYSPEFIEMYYGKPVTYQGLEYFFSLFFQLFIHMKFYPIFSFLFGLGFYFFLKKTNGMNLFIKRLLVLLMFGLFHLVFIWYGDILHLYALAGLLLIFFRKLSNRYILYWAFFFISLYHIVLSATVFYIPAGTQLNEPLYNNIVSEYTSVYAEASYPEWLLYRLKIEILPILLQIPFAMIPVLGMFLLGLYTGKKQLYLHNEDNDLHIKNICKWSFLLSLPFLAVNILILTSTHSFGISVNRLSHFLTSISGIIMSIFYMSSFYFLTKKSNALFPFHFIGKMALTNYLLQSIICIGFYRFFHLYGQIGLLEGTLFSMILFSSQLLFSYFWLIYFHHGPFEWIWRCFTYGKLVPFKRWPANKYISNK